jgi:hypothetical protein
MKTLAQKFWSKVQKSDGCWLWTGATTPDGYGKIGADRRSTTGSQPRAHRVSWTLHCGPIPEGMEVLHKCDNPPCVRPDHLFIGTQRDNVMDMQAKGRARKPRGEAHGRAKLTIAEVVSIRERAALGWKQRDLAKEFRVARSLVGRIVLMQAWAHLQEGPR